VGRVWSSPANFGTRCVIYKRNLSPWLLTRTNNEIGEGCGGNRIIYLPLCFLGNFSGITTFQVQFWKRRYGLGHRGDAVKNSSGSCDISLIIDVFYLYPNEYKPQF
jgi:hypothetical protein